MVKLNSQEEEKIVFVVEVFGTFAFINDASILCALFWFEMKNKIMIQEENKLLFEQIEIIYVHDVSKQESFFTKDTRSKCLHKIWL